MPLDSTLYRSVRSFVQADLAARTHMKRAKAAFLKGDYRKGCSHLRKANEQVILLHKISAARNKIRAKRKEALNGNHR